MVALSAHRRVVGAGAGSETNRGHNHCYGLKNSEGSCVGARAQLPRGGGAGDTRLNPSSAVNSI